MSNYSMAQSVQNQADCSLLDQIEEEEKKENRQSVAAARRTGTNLEATNYFVDDNYLD